MKIRLLHDRILVRPLETEERTVSGIIIPDTAKEKPQQGEVIAVGPGARTERGEVVPLDIKPGDRVLFGKWSGSEVEIEGTDYVILREEDILAAVGTLPGVPTIPPDDDESENGR